MDGLDALFGPSHHDVSNPPVQLELDRCSDLVSRRPCPYHAVLNEGPLLVSDMFKLYRFENMLYTHATNRR